MIDGALALGALRVGVVNVKGCAVDIEPVKGADVAAAEVLDGADPGRLLVAAANQLKDKVVLLARVDGDKVGV